MGHAVHVLAGQQTVADLVLVSLQVLGQGAEHQYAVDIRVGVHLVDDGNHLLLGGIGGQHVILDRHTHQLGALGGALFIAQVGGVLTHADDAQGGHDALFPQGGGTGLQIGVQGIGNFFAQQQLGHWYDPPKNY